MVKPRCSIRNHSKRPQPFSIGDAEKLVDDVVDLGRLPGPEHRDLASTSPMATTKYSLSPDLDNPCRVCQMRSCASVTQATLSYFECAKISSHANHLDEGAFSVATCMLVIHNVEPGTKHACVPRVGYPIAWWLCPCDCCQAVEPVWRWMLLTAHLVQPGLTQVIGTNMKPYLPSC